MKCATKQIAEKHLIVAWLDFGVFSHARDLLYIFPGWFIYFIYLFIYLFIYFASPGSYVYKKHWRQLQNQAGTPQQ